MTTADLQPGHATRAQLRADPRSVSELLRDLVNQLNDLFRDEMNLARAEMSSKISGFGSGLVVLMTGAILSLAGLIVLLDAAVFGLARILPPWAAAVAVGGAVAIIGLILIFQGRSALSARGLMPTRTARTLRESTGLAKETGE